MKPSDHPDFFRLPAPEGRSRESTLRLDGEGRFWHDGALVAHAGLRAALHRWIGRHPLDGRYVLTNGYDWTYFTVDGAPFFVAALRIAPDHVALVLTDGTEETWRPEDTREGAQYALYTQVKRGAPGGPFAAKFTRHAQNALAPLLVESGGEVAVRIGGAVTRLGPPSGQRERERDPRDPQA
jgi:hypothetical protein